MNILQINDLPNFDTSIENYEVHSYNPYNNSFRENDEIRIPIHQQDIYVLPSASSIYIEGRAKLFSKDGNQIKKSVTFSNNPIMFLFQDIRYEINGIEIDRIKNADIQRIQWRVPHVKVSDRERLKLLKHLERDKPIEMAFRNWDLYEYPLLPTATNHSWSIKTASQLEKPRYVIFCLQTNRKNQEMKDCSVFDHCGPLSNIVRKLT
ncbi:unnamed protein product [Parnassius mnemosyne]|uniref:Double jelly roll-like domain-containing protein n=1 Tax=Parnassius mnemosyne TaxID=213953 RepID=A0AAV1LRN5_9NEOP